MFGSVGKTLGGAVINGCHIYVAVHHEGNLLAVGRHGYLGCPISVNLSHEVAVVAVGNNLYSHLCRLLTGDESVNLAVISEAELAVGR